MASTVIQSQETWTQEFRFEKNPDGPVAWKGGFFFLNTEIDGDGERQYPAFSGYVTLTPMMLLGVRWPRLTAAGAIASILVGNALLAGGTAGVLPTFGFLPVFWAWLGGFAAAIAVSLAGRAPEAATLERAFG